MDLRSFCLENDACEEGVARLGSQSLAEAYASCEHVGDALWMLSVLGFRAEAQKLAFEAADRAVRIYAPMALDRAGLTEQAAGLRALPEIVDAPTAAFAAAAVRAAAVKAAAKAAWAAEVAARAARAERAARAAAGAVAARAQVAEHRLTCDAARAAVSLAQIEAAMARYKAGRK